MSISRFRSFSRSSATMARRESRASRDYNRGMEKMRKHMEAEMQEKEEKLRTAAKIMVLKDMESWRSDREQLLDERKTMQKNLSVTEEEKRKLKSDVQEEKDKNRNREEEIWSFHCQLSTQKEKYDSANALWWRKLHEVLEKAAGAIKKRDEQVIFLERSLHAEKEDTERKRTSVEEESSRLESVKESWRQKVSQLEDTHPLTQL
ncbi:vicilin-like seed storage protein At2g18540 [Thunnus albacares]|uniref:vicilin-like seed storage protein At2g18540 n=1 Tax=Thunnus albacares TaxID=8236 RepID=UPI001CF61BB3|nr:vicilin-like seed storage protein At2g18540 [Thunnus albacares]